ncbi:MAG: phosphoglycerate transporter [Dehalococcoidia bacterium]|nr:MAG: phosphoglycerate transporter [Dehalococcoidia bacterium]
MLNIGWFSTGRDEAARQLLQTVQESIQAGEIQGKISFVFSNREPREARESDLFFDLVRSHDIPLVCFSHRKFRSRLLRSARNDRTGLHNDGTGVSNDTASDEERENWRLKYDREVVKKIESFAPDICVLAGYMLIIGEELCRKYNMINLHPAPPGGPTGTWQEVMWTLIQSKAEKAGAMMHLVTRELDRGPAVSYCLFPVRGAPFDSYWEKDDKEALFRLIRQHELAREFPLIISTLKAFSEGSIKIKDGKIVDAQANPIEGYDLSERIGQAVKSEIASRSLS